MRYLMIICIVLWLPDVSVAQIVYVDLDPDVRLAASHMSAMDYFLDMDNDGVDEFWFMHFNVTPPGVSCDVFTAQDGDAEMLVRSMYKPLAIQKFDTIQSTSEQWVCTVSGSNNWAQSLDDEWCGKGDRYLGVRFYRDDEWHYGWVRIEAEADRSAMTLKDYAWESTAGRSILAGVASTTGIIASSQPDEISISQSGHSVSINAGNQVLRHVAVYDMLGSMRLERDACAGHLVLDLSGLARGLYLLRAETGSSSRTTRIAL